MMLRAGSRVALLSSMEAVPWIPIVGGFADGLRGLGLDARVFRIAARPELHLAELDAFRPELVLFFPHSWEADCWSDYVPPNDRPTVWAICAFDDPYDMRSTLALASSHDLARGFLGILTRAPLAVDVYRRLGFRAAALQPCVSSGHVMAPRRDGVFEADVLQVGGTHWTPRKRLLPVVRTWAAKTGRRYGEAAGAGRWLVGGALRQALSRSRVVLEIPRFDLPRVTNPYQVPDTEASPRLQLCAAAGTVALIVTDRPQSADPLEELFPRVNTAGPAMLEALDYLTDPRNAVERLELAEEAQRVWLSHHHPRVRCAELLERLTAWGVSLDPVLGDRARQWLSQREPRECMSLPTPESADGLASQQSEQSETDGQSL